MTSHVALARILVGCVVVVLGGAACASKPDTGCMGGLNTPACRAQCGQFTTCGECAAQPSCGWCAGAPVEAGMCVPASNGEDHRSQRPESCTQDWFYRPAKLSEPAGAPYCPAPTQ